MLNNIYTTVSHNEYKSYYTINISTNNNNYKCVHNTLNKTGRNTSRKAFLLYPRLFDWKRFFYSLVRMETRHVCFDLYLLYFNR